MTDESTTATTTPTTTPTATPTTSDGTAERGQVNTSAADVYDEFFVPALFGQFPERVLDHAGASTGESVLDVGCGTGVLAGAAARRGRANRVVGVDPTEAMLAVASRRSDEIEWQLGSAEQLPFADATFDHVVSQFAAMFFVDRAAAVAEMGRVARPAGTVTIATWAELSRSPGYDAMVRLVASEIGTEAADALRAPFSIGTEDELATVMSTLDGSMTLGVADGVARFASIERWVHTDIRGWTLADLVDDEAEARLLERARDELSMFIGADGTVEFPAPAIIATVRLPA